MHGLSRLNLGLFFCEGNHLLHSLPVLWPDPIHHDMQALKEIPKEPCFFSAQTQKKQQIPYPVFCSFFSNWWNTFWNLMMIVNLTIKYFESTLDKHWFLHWLISDVINLIDKNFVSINLSYFSLRDLKLNRNVKIYASFFWLLRDFKSPISVHTSNIRK